jgi:hypothetical protein
MDLHRLRKNAGTGQERRTSGALARLKPDVFSIVYGTTEQFAEKCRFREESSPQRLKPD